MLSGRSSCLPNSLLPIPIPICTQGSYPCQILRSRLDEKRPSRQRTYRPASNNSLAHLLKVSRVPVFFPRVASWHRAPRRSLDVPANALVVIAATGEVSRNVAWRWAVGRIGVKRGKQQISTRWN
jgi:hypothetical protein